MEAVGRHRDSSEINLMRGTLGNPSGGMWSAPVTKLRTVPKLILNGVSPSSSRGISRPPMKHASNTVLLYTIGSLHVNYTVHPL